MRQRTEKFVCVVSRELLIGKRSVLSPERVAMKPTCSHHNAWCCDSVKQQKQEVCQRTRTRKNNLQSTCTQWFRRKNRCRLVKLPAAGDSPEQGEAQDNRNANRCQQRTYGRITRAVRRPKTGDIDLRASAKSIATWYDFGHFADASISSIDSCEIG